MPPASPTRPQSDATRSRRRWSAVLALALAVALLAPVGALAPAGAQEHGGPEVPYATAADGAAAWLTSRFDADGEDWWANEHADFILALAATNGDRTRAMRSLDLMEAATPAYVQPTPTATNHGGAAKVMLAAQTLDAAVDDVGGLDLEQLLRDGMATEGPDTGRVGAATPFTQPLIIMALERTDAGAPQPMVDWLISKQCADGGFSWGSCSFTDADYTGLAASALHAAGATAARDDALDWLEDHQGADGGFHASNSPESSNTNSTGLAVQALRAAGRDATVIDAGAEYVSSARLTTGDDVGAIAWKPGTTGSLFLATTQGVLAWGAPTYATLAFPEIVGEPCPPAEGVTVVVDLAHFDDSIRVGCAPGAQASGAAAMEAAGFDIGWHPDYPGGGPGLGGAVCQLEGHPSIGYPECWFTGFWSYWHARPDAQWVFSNCGIDNRTPRQGSVEGWRYEPDVNNHTASQPLIDAHWPQVTVDVPAELTPGEEATVEVAVDRTEQRAAPAPGDDPEPCSLPPDAEPEDHTPTLAGPVTDGLVEVRVDGEPIGDPVALDEAGTISIDTVLPDGEHEVTAHFLGSATDLAAPSTASDVRVAPETATTVTAEPNPAGIGEEVALTATVVDDTDAAVAEGDVELRVDGEPVGDPVTVGDDGRATATTTFDAIGEHEISAHYLGSASGLSSDSEPVTITVEEGVDELEQLVIDLYDAVLGRAPEQAGLDYWVGRFEDGTPPEALAESLARTREGWKQVVRQHYRLALDREGEAAGVEYWTDTLQRTNRPDDLLTMLFASPEVFEVRSGGTNEGYVTYLYQRVLGRSPSQADFGYWVGRIDAFPGQDSIARRDAARALVFTPEGVRRQVDANHRGVCGGDAPSAALDELTALFQASRLNPSTLRAAIVIRGCPT